MTFDECMEVIFKWEGGYTNDPNDPGGETNLGISKKAFPDLDIKNLTKKHASLIYKEQYYYKVYGDQLPKEIRLLVFNSAVNQGVSFAVKTLQKIVGAPIDGKMGLNTLDKVLITDPLRIKKEFLSIQIDHYFSLKKDMFIKGWIKRLVDVAAS